jgi:hypothetical protein
MNYAFKKCLPLCHFATLPCTFSNGARSVLFQSRSWFERLSPALRPAKLKVALKLVAPLLCVWKVPASVLAKETVYTVRNYMRDFKFSPRSKNCALLGHYAACSDNSLGRFGTTYRSHPYGIFGFLTIEDGTDGFSRNVGKELPPLAA